VEIVGIREHGLAGALSIGDLAFRVEASVITAKPANGYHFKTGHSTNVRDKVFYSFNRD